MNYKELLLLFIMILSYDLFRNESFIKQLETILIDRFEIVK